MPANSQSVVLDVDRLRKGMYVVQPDRPWLDLPFLFQGFAIESDDEIRVFREYCRQVYIDPERCAEPFEEQGEHNPAPTETTSRDQSRRERGATSRASETVEDAPRYPDVDHFRSEVESADRARATARRFLDEAFQGANRGQGVNISDARSIITDLMTRIAETPIASMWLTSLNDCDDFTPSHSINTCVLVLSFCLRSRIDTRRLEVIGLGTLLHDVGKSVLPPELLNRPGPLTEEEWERVRQHPITGHNILGDSGNMPRGALNITSMHHERLDGHGYPHGLSGSDLPNYVLLPALANRYHALISPRPYRQATAPDRVLQAFYNEADACYGTRTVQAFMRGIGLYPVGSLVELDNGALAVVVSSRPNTRLRPTVQLVRTPDGRPYEKIILLNLAAEDERRKGTPDGVPARMVRRVRSPAETGIDPGAVIAESFGIGIT